MKKLNKFMITIIKKYQQNKQIIGVGHCRFHPSCSNYALEVFTKFSFFRAFFLMVIRIIRCNPLAKRRYYPAPLTKQEKKSIAIVENLKVSTDPKLIEMLLENSNFITTTSLLKALIYGYYTTQPSSSSYLKQDIILGEHVALAMPKDDIIFSKKTYDLDIINHIVANLFELSFLQVCYRFTDLEPALFPIVDASLLPLSYFLNSIEKLKNGFKIIGICTSLKITSNEFSDLNFKYQLIINDLSPKHLWRLIKKLCKNHTDIAYIIINPHALVASLITYYDYTISINQQTTFKPHLKINRH